MEVQPTIAIVGGGVSGALTACHLLKGRVPVRVVVVDPNRSLGLGLAYSTPSLRHLLNVPASKMSALPDQPSHFVDWLRRNWSPSLTGDEFVPRAVFGRYMKAVVSTTPGIEHLQTEALDCTLNEEGATLGLADGGRLHAKTVVLATGNFDPPALPGVSPFVERQGAYCHSAWAEKTFDNLDNEAPVTLIGTGLTAIDVLLRLREQGHCGTVTALSRHGVFPNRHSHYEPLPEPLLPVDGDRNVRELLHLVHQALRRGDDWRAVIDSLRPRTNEIWLSLPLVEQRRFRRHLQRRWDVVRHRMAPQIARALDTELRHGTLVPVRGFVHAVLSDPHGARVLFSSKGSIRQAPSARVINCTGPNMNYRKVGSPLLSSLFAQKLIVEGPIGFGLASDEHGALRSADGTASERLFNVGPGRLGMLLESIAVPELREQAAHLAEFLASKFRRSFRQHRASEPAAAPLVVRPSKSPTYTHT